MLLLFFVSVELRPPTSIEIEMKVKKIHNNKTKATSEFTETVILINGISTVSDIFVWQIEMVDFFFWQRLLLETLL